MNYRLSDISTICGGKLIGTDHLCRSAITDSRLARAAEEPVFFAIAGLNHNGHDYIGELYSRGVRGFVVEQPVDATEFPQAGFVQVQNSVDALQKLAQHHRNNFQGIVIGITGSNGKTVVKEWAAQIAPHRMKMARSPRSYNSQIGVPLSVLMISGDEDVALIEAGISLPGEMERLERIIRPDIGIITNIGDAHQENFRDIGHKLDEKLILLRNAKIIIYNGNYPQIALRLHEIFPAATGLSANDTISRSKMVEQVYGVPCPAGDGGCKIISSEAAQKAAKDPHRKDAASSQTGVKLIDSSTQGAAYAFFKERTAQENAATVVTLYDTLGYPHVETIARLAQLQPVAMRLELKEGLGDSLIIDDSYNADLNSLATALDYLRSSAAGRPTVVILSDILQSGLAEEELYHQVAAMVEAAGISRLIGVGENIKRHGELFSCPKEFHLTTDALLAALDERSLTGCTILIKGNRSSQFEKLSHALQLRTHTTKLEVDLDAMAHNLSHFRSKLQPATKVMAMIKALSYGNGGYEVASMLQRQGIDYLGVAFADEGVALRQRGIAAPIVVLNADQDSFGIMISSSLEPEIYSFTSLNAFEGELLRRSERSWPVHIKLDTGMHRLGFTESEIDTLIDRLKSNPLIRVASVFSHLAASDEVAQDDFTRLQIERFGKMSGRLAEALPYPFLRHISNSAAVERIAGAQMDMVRVGIGLYGVSNNGDSSLKPVATMLSRIVQIKELTEGETVGYGRAGKITRRTRLATVPVGYADGLDRRLGEGHWAMLVNGEKAPIVGRICMDTCMIDITDIDGIEEGCEVTVFGSAEGNRTEDMARIMGTIPYEVMTGISARVKRIFIKE